jgi:hypothetical protein
MGEVYMDKGRVGEDRGSKETNGCPLTIWPYYKKFQILLSTVVEWSDYIPCGLGHTYVG